MSIGTLSRRALRGVLTEILAQALPGVEEVAHIHIEAVPQGIADRGFALESFRSRDDRARKRRDTHVLKQHTVTLKYAKRLGTAHDVSTDRGIAEDDVDAIERALRNSDSPHTAEYSCESFDVDEGVDPTGEWIVIAMTIVLFVQFKLMDPNEPATALE